MKKPRWFVQLMTPGHRCGRHRVARLMARAKLGAGAGGPVYVLLLHLFCVPPPAQPHSILLSSSDRARLLQWGSETSQLIAIVSIEGKEVFRGADNFPYTRYIGTATTRFFPASSPDSVVTFQQPGGTLDGKAYHSSGTHRFIIGSQYLIFLIKCPEHPYPDILDPSLVAQISGLTAKTTNPPGDVPISALTDSILDFVSLRSFQHQRDAAHLVILGHPESVPARLERPTTALYRSGTFTLRITTTYLQTDGPTVADGDVVSLRVDPVYGGEAVSSGSVPPLSPDEPAVYFLRYLNGWTLGSSTYARWRQVGSMLYVDYEHSCQGSPALPLDSLETTTALDLLGH